MELYNAAEFQEETLRDIREVLAGLAGGEPHGIDEETILSERQWERLGKKLCEEYPKYRIRDSRKAEEKNGLTIRECLDLIEVLI